MEAIQSTYCGTPTPLHKTIVGFTSILAVSALALSIMGFTASSSGPLNSIVQLGTITNGILLGTSVFVLILDLFWITTLCKKKNKLSISSSQTPEPYQEWQKRFYKGNYPDLQRNPGPMLDQIDSSGLKQDPVVILPKDINVTIFFYLDMGSLGRICQISKRWKELAYGSTLLWNALDLEKIFPALDIFDESAWAAHFNLSANGMSIGDIPPFNKRQAIPVLKKYLSSLPIEENAGITLFTIPKGLTLNKLVKLDGTSSKKGAVPKFIAWDTEGFGDVEIKQTYRIVITNQVFKGSQDLLSFSRQEEFVKKADCRVPKTIEVAALLALTFMSSGKRLYSSSNCSFTRCSEKLANFQMTVGGFTSSRNNISISVYTFEDNLCGVGGVWEPESFNT